MYKSLAALAFSLNLAACAGTMQQAQTATATTQECKMVDQSDSTGTHIAARQECKASGGQAAGAPQR